MLLEQGLIHSELVKRDPEPARRNHHHIHPQRASHLRRLQKKKLKKNKKLKKLYAKLELARTRLGACAYRMV